MAVVRSRDLSSHYQTLSTVLPSLVICKKHSETALPINQALGGGLVTGDWDGQQRSLTSSAMAVTWGANTTQTFGKGTAANTTAPAPGGFSFGATPGTNTPSTPP